jgi:ketosteroid isomerase-like protein
MERSTEADHHRSPHDGLAPPVADGPHRSLEADIGNLRRAFASLDAGDSEPVVSMLDRDVHWLGIRRGHLWWRSARTQNGPDQVRVVFPFRDSSRSQASGSVRVDEFIDAGDRIVIAYNRPGDLLRGATTTDCFFQAVTMSDGKVVHVHDHRRRKDALKKGSGRGW